MPIGFALAYRIADLLQTKRQLGSFGKFCLLKKSWSAQRSERETIRNVRMVGTGYSLRFSGKRLYRLGIDFRRGEKSHFRAPILRPFVPNPDTRGRRLAWKSLITWEFVM